MSLQDRSGPTATSMALRRATNEACLQTHLEAEQHHDMAATLATLHPECVFEDYPAGLRLCGHEGARRHYEMWWRGFGVGLDAGRLDWVTDDRVIGQAVFVGTHSGNFLGIEATGRAIRLPFVVEVCFLDGLLLSERFLYDMNNLLLQLGQPAFRPPANEASS